MPVLSILTNLPKEKIPATFTKDISALMAAKSGRAETHNLVHVVPGQMMTFGGTDAPCGVVTIFSPGNLNPEANKKYSAAIAENAQKHLGIPSDRIYINFMNLDKSNIGFKGTTLAALT